MAPSTAGRSERPAGIRSTCSRECLSTEWPSARRRGTSAPSLSRSTCTLRSSTPRNREIPVWADGSRASSHGAALCVSSRPRLRRTSPPVTWAPAAAAPTCLASLSPPPRSWALRRALRRLPVTSWPSGKTCSPMAPPHSRWTQACAPSRWAAPTDRTSSTSVCWDWRTGACSCPPCPCPPYCAQWTPRSLQPPPSRPPPPSLSSTRHPSPRV
mmetsp:Transcript_15521/g.34274  ORF Transcript_15521/g.34274 Transcript_15521/m.34274 type:complete len:213 (+) Transcript_15521:1060-1698(+)